MLHVIVHAVRNATHRTILLGCLILPLASVAGFITTAWAEDVTPRPPNIIFIITDDMRTEMFNCLPEGEGRNLTPNIDRLADEGVLMMGQHVVSPVCTPSRYNCLTGRYASRARNEAFVYEMNQKGQAVVQWNTFIVPGETTLPKLLQRAGYVTGMVGKNHVVEVQGLEAIPWEADPRDPAVAAALKANAGRLEKAVRAVGFDYAENLYHNNPDKWGAKALAAHNLDWITQGGLDFIDQNRDTPFFLYFATTVPHGPNTDDRSWDADPLVSAEGYLDEPLNALPPRDTIPIRLKEAGLSPDNNKANLLWLDDAVGALMARIHKHGLDENTIIIFFNDHGQNAKGTIYQGGVHNPGILWRKGGFPVGSVSRARVTNVDFAPTILELAGVDVTPGTFDGLSLLPILMGQADEIHTSLYFEMGYTRGVLKDNYKYIALRYPPFATKMTLEERQRRLNVFNAEMTRRGLPFVTTDPAASFSHIQLIPGGGDAERESTTAYPGYYDPDQLYDLARDPREQHNLASLPEYQERLDLMKAELREYLADLPGTFAEFRD